MKKLPRYFFIFSSFLAIPSTDFATQIESSDQMHSQMTIYVAAPLLERGGTVIVVSNAVPLDEWKHIQPGRNPARDDPQNEKRRELRSGDRLFGAIASTKLAIVEFVYPEGGTFGFNLVPLATSSAGSAHDPILMTKRVLVGDGGYTDWKTGKEYLWESVSTIYVAGPEASESDSRAASVAESKIMNLPPHKTIFEGAKVYEPTEEELKKILIDVPQ